MHRKIKAGAVEVTEPSKEMVDLTKAVIEQNKMVLEMNAKLINSLSAPVMITEWGEKK